MPPRKQGEGIHMEDKTRVQESWRARGFSFGVYSDPPGHRWENFAHGNDEIFMAVEGKVELQIGRRKWMPKTGEEILIPAGEKHSVRNIGRTPSKWFYGYRA